MLASFICAVCFEEIETVVDTSQGVDQEYIEDCSICCRPNVLRVHIEPDGEITIDASFEE